MTQQSEGFVDSQGVKIHYLATGTLNVHDVSLLFVPGIMMPAWIWEKQLDYFSKRYRVVAMDPRSQGDSEQSSEGNYALSRAGDIKSVIDKLRLEPCLLIGWSLGVPEVLNYAAHFSSEKLIGLVLVDGLMGVDSSLSFYESTVNYWSEFQMDRLSKTREFIRCIFKHPPSEEYLEKLLEAAMRTPTNTVMTLINNYILQDFRFLLPHISIPTLITTVEGPRLDYMQKMHELLPRSQLEIFHSAAHALFMDQPTQFNNLLEEFIRRSYQIFESKRGF